MTDTSGPSPSTFLAHPLVQPLGLVIKANTDGAEGVAGVANTFVYTVLLMVITGLTMYLVYGRTSRGRTTQKRPRGIPAAPVPGSSLVDVSGDKEPAAPVR
ncbi:UNVERIFIED_ORG: fumarate reductase subunit D [Arthrobacter sp. UYCu721]